MPRFKEITDDIATATGREQRHLYLVDIPSQDWTTEILIEFQGTNDRVQLKKSEDGSKWELASTIPDGILMEKKQTHKNRKPV